MGKVDFDVNALVAHAAAACVMGVNETLEAARTHAVDHTRVDTGFLRSRWAVEEASLKGTHVVGTLYNDTPYAPFVNWPRKGWAGDFTLEGAVDAEFPTVGARIGRYWS
jgi:hypothetical protein